MFQLTEDVASALRSQFVTVDTGRGRYSKIHSPGFTEHGESVSMSTSSD